MANDLAVRSTSMMTGDELERLQRVAKMFSVSSLFAAKGDDPKAIAETAVKIMAGQEIGLGPFASVQNIQVIQGNPTFSGHMIASAIKGSGKYDYKIVRWDEKECAIQFYENREKVGDPLSYTIEEARNAQLTGKDVWKKFPRAMLFNRAISMGYRAYCPDVFGGMRAYTPEELGAVVDEEGSAIVVDGHVVIDNGTQGRTEQEEIEAVWREAEPIDPSGGKKEEQVDDWPSDEFSPYASALLGPYEIDSSVQSILEKYKGLQESSSRKMSEAGYKLITKLLIDGGDTKIDGASYTLENGFIEGSEIDAFFETLTQTEIDGIPGAQVGKPLLEDIMFNGPYIDGVVALMREIADDTK